MVPTTTRTHLKSEEPVPLISEFKPVDPDAFSRGDLLLVREGTEVHTYGNGVRALHRDTKFIVMTHGDGVINARQASMSHGGWNPRGVTARITPDLEGGSVTLIGHVPVPEGAGRGSHG